MSATAALNILRWLLAIGLFYFWLTPLVCNLWGPVSVVANRFRRSPMRHVSPAPFIGGIAGTFILLAIPVGELRTRGWAILVALLPEIVFVLTLALSLLLWLATTVMHGRNPPVK